MRRSKKWLSNLQLISLTFFAIVRLVIIIKTDKEIAAMRVAGKRHAEILHKVADLVKPGISTMELDAAAEKMIRDYGDRPAFLGYQPEGAKIPYPATLCTSVNNEVVHGIPDKKRILQEGDVISLDLGLQHDGVFTDSAITVPVGKISPEIAELLSVTKQALQIGINAARVGNTTGDIGHAIETFVNKKYGIVEGYSGHGVGRAIHEDPYVPNYGKPGSGEKLKPGMTIAIEPMLNMGKKHVKLLSDGYTVVTRDSSISAHFEHTILITENGPEIFTKKS